jgi:hypothetical protein
MKKTGLMIFIIIFLVACSDVSVKKPPEITVQYGETNINYVVGLSSWDGVDYDREDSFNRIMQNNDFETLPYIELYSEIIFRIDEKNVPEKMVLYEYVLDGNGNNGYAYREILFSLENGKGSFILDTHIAALLSSSSKENKPDTTIRGLKLICTWGENECEYAFIINTDAP